MSNAIVVQLDGKYEVTSKNGSLTVKRYGQPWRDLTGDKLMLSLVYEIDRLRDIINEKEKRDDPFGRNNVST